MEFVDGDWRRCCLLVWLMFLVVGENVVLRCSGSRWCWFWVLQICAVVLEFVGASAVVLSAV